MEYLQEITTTFISGLALIYIDTYYSPLVETALRHDYSTTQKRR